MSRDDDANAVVVGRNRLSPSIIVYVYVWCIAYGVE